MFLLPRYRQRSVSPGLGVRGVKRGCFAIGAVKQGISGSDTGIRRRFFVQHDLDKHVEGFNRVLARKLLEVPQHLWALLSSVLSMTRRAMFPSMPNFAQYTDANGDRQR